MVYAKDVDVIRLNTLQHSRELNNLEYSFCVNRLNPVFLNIRIQYGGSKLKKWIFMLFLIT